MAYQTGRNILVAYAPEVTFGTLPAAGTAAKIFRPNSGSLSLTKETIRSNENRRDGQMTRGRHGSRAVGGSYTGDLSLGSYDDFIQAVFRGTFDTAVTTTTAAVAGDSAAKTFTRAAGSWIADGLRVGDVVRAAGFATTGTANNGRNFRITAVTATVMTVAEAPATVTSAAGITFARPKKLVMGTTPRSFAVEEAELDIDVSEVFTGVRVGQLAIRLAPNGMGELTFTFVGQDMQPMQGVNSPYFTSTTLTTSLGMTAVEAVIRLGGADVLDLTAVDLSINLNANAQPVVGSVLTPDVFTNLANVEGSVTALRSDISRVQSFLNEDQLSLHLLFTENEPEPKDFCSFFVGNLSLSGATKSELGADGPRTQQLPILPGIDERGGAYDLTTVKYQTSAA